MKDPKENKVDPKENKVYRRMHLPLLKNSIELLISTTTIEFQLHLPFTEISCTVPQLKIKKLQSFTNTLAGFQFLAMAVPIPECPGAF